MDRRGFCGSAAALTGTIAASGLLATPALAQDSGPAYAGAPKMEVQEFHTQQQQFRISYTTNTRGGWEGSPFVGITEGRDVGFRYFEIFGASFCPTKDGLEGAPGDIQKMKTWENGYSWKYPTGPRAKREVYYPDRWEALQHRMYEIGAQFTAITGGAATGSIAFQDPAQRQAVIDNHFNMARFSRRFGCDHQKTNTGPRQQPDGTPVADLKEIAITLDALGKRLKEELGMRFGVHAHLGSQIQNQAETDYIMEHTNPDHVGLVLDTGHITMAGMDPVALTKKLGNRICEFHLKDTKKEDRGGTRNVPRPDRDMMNDPYFYPLGEGGVDFPAIMAHLKSINWRGHLTVELDTSPWRPPRESARITADYIRNVLKLEL
jgi:sugar phosphate isomerase/epimerase